MPYKTAAKDCKENIVNLLNGDINKIISTKKFTGTLLNFACKENNIQLVEKLLEKGVDVNEGYDEITPLLLACKSNNPELAKILLEKGADVNYRLEEGNSYLHEACKDRYIEMVDLLIENGADPNIEDKRSGRVPLHELCSVNKLTETEMKIIKLLIKKRADKKGADIDFLDYSKRTPLFYASSSDCIQAVKILVKSGAGINKTESNGETPLHRAVDNNSIEIVQFLTENGADVNAIFLEDDENDDEIEEDNRIPVTPLNKAVNENYIEVAKHLILYVLLSNPEKPDYITDHASLSNFWDITLKKRNELINNFPPRCSIVEFLSDNVAKLAVRLTLKDINKIAQAVEQEENKIPNPEAAVGEVENPSYALLIKTRLEKLEERQKSLNLIDKLRITSKNEKEITLNFIVNREIASYLSTREIKKVLNASLSPKSESTMTDPMIQNNAIDFLHSKPSSLEQEDNKHFRQSLEEQAKENTSRLEISKDSLESISHMMGSSGSSGLFANRKRKQDESSSESPERNKLLRLEH